LHSRASAHNTATPLIYPLSLHDALPISPWQHTSICRKSTAHVEARSLNPSRSCSCSPDARGTRVVIRNSRYAAWSSGGRGSSSQDRKSTRLNSSHVKISYAVFCLKKKRK